jgi:uncharacterized protein YcbK (DUF882 family)
LRFSFLTALVAALLIGLVAPASAGKSKKKRRQPVFRGWAVPASQFRSDPLPRPSGHLKLFSVNFKEYLEVDLFGDEGEYSDEALEQLNHFWRCRRTGTEKPIDPRLFELLAIIYDHYEGRTIELVSGFRNQPRTSSKHFHGSAADIKIAGVPDKELHRFAASLDTGHLGLGLYPRAGFIHVDARPGSYRWIDWSPPGSEMGHPHKKKKAPAAKKKLRTT